jgi:two-component system response regulator YesN
MKSPYSLISFSLLIVEDEKLALDVVVRMIGRRFPNCTIHTATNGIEGREIFKQFTPDVVMTDLKMLVMDGIEMIREIRSINPNATYIVLTTYSDKVNLKKIDQLGVCTYLLKPLDFKELFAAIEKCTAEVRPQPS